MENKNSFKISAFTMVELAIVVVIIGLLISAVLGGQTLIDVNRRMTFISDMSNFKIAYDQFKSKYAGVPGDLSDAETYFGVSETENGNGDDLIDEGNDEPYLAWQHLSLAGFFKGTYSGVKSASSGSYGELETDIPMSPFSGSGYMMFADVQRISANTNSLQSGSYDSNVNRYYGGFISPRESQEIDIKLDDNNPSKGQFISLDASTGGACINDNSTPEYSDDTYQSSDDKTCRTIYYFEPVISQ